MTNTQPSDEEDKSTDLLSSSSGIVRQQATETHENSPLNTVGIETGKGYGTTSNSAIDKATTAAIETRHIISTDFDNAHDGIIDPESNIIEDLNDHTTDNQLLAQARKEHKLKPWYKRPSLYTMCAAIFVFSFSTSIGSASQTILQISGMCHKMMLEDPDLTCDSPIVQRSTLELQKSLTFFPSLVSILVLTKLGQLSDHFGRKPILLFSLCCMSVDQIINFIFLNPAWSKFVPWVYICADTFSSFGGDLDMVMALATAYVADVVDPEKVSQGLGTVTASLVFGIGMGTFTGSFLSLSPVQLMGLCSLLCIGNVLVCLLFFPESRPQCLNDRARKQDALQKRTNAQKRQASLEQHQQSGTSLSFKDKITGFAHDSGLGHLVDIFSSLKLFWITEYDSYGNIDWKPRFNALCLLVIFILLLFGAEGEGACLMLYATFKFHWDNTILARVMGLQLAAKSFGLLVINPFVNNKLTLKFTKQLQKVDKVDKILLAVCVSASIVSTIIVIESKTTLMFCLVAIPGCFSTMTMPTLQAALLKYNRNPEKNGEFFGVLAFFTNFIGLFAPLIFYSIYSYSIEFNPNLVFELGAGLLGLVVAVSLFLKT
ncbi:unnamed protein product [Ambrosiozyma monospora]|uniref:Unnamed protein product n=1 Tax=Ambrosiozyma monospora TaxID=43982 RepID=A0ACB5SRI1_AMBMO|nr:unnamed protein product [Ambrosiozyma monospora]